MTMREGIRRKAAHRCSNLRAVVGDVFAVENRCSAGQIISIDDHVAPDGRVMEVLSEHLCQAWLEGYLLTGRHGLFATYEAFAMVSASMTIQHTKWLDMDAAVKYCTAGVSVWHWASNDQGSEPDVVLAAAGDTPTPELAGPGRERRGPDVPLPSAPPPA